ncbi:MAG: hypothetical protein LH468_01020 [Nocardioides sp.]|nr:hypothetical protein [Nocardioides sp.]
MVAALVLVVMAGTVAGVAELVASSAYDYHLQSAQLDLMGSMGGTCVAACGEQMHHATLALQVRAVGYGSGLILMSNVLVVGWVVALRGGRITLIRRRTPRSASTWQRLLRLRRVAGSSTDHRHHLPGRPADLAVLMAAALASAGLLHAAVVPEHLAYWPAAGVFFVLLAGAQLAAAGALVFSRARRLVVLGAVVVSVGPLPLWLCSRSIGIPVGPQAGTPEPVGLADSAAGVLQLGACWSVSSSCAPGRGHLDLPRSSSSGLRSWVSWPSPPSAWAGAV